MSAVEKEMKHSPEFVEKLQNMGIPEGTPVRLECRVVGMPPPLIFWKKDNETIPRTKDRVRWVGVQGFVSVSCTKGTRMMLWSGVVWAAYP